MFKRIYLSPPHLDGREKELIVEAYDSNWITLPCGIVDRRAPQMARAQGGLYFLILSAKDNVE